MVRIVNWIVRLEAIEAATARDLSPGAQGRVGPRRAMPAAMCNFTRAFGLATSGIIPRRRGAHDVAHHIAHDANRECLAPICDEAEFDPGAAGKIRGVFFKISRSMRRRSFSRRGRAISAARSAPADGIAAALEYACGDPAFPRSPASRLARSLDAAIPSSRAIWRNGRRCSPAVLPTPA